MTITLTTQPREASTKLDVLRAEGLVPAVYYGQGSDAVSIALDHQETVKVCQEAGHSTIITLETADGPKQALIHDMDVHPVTHKLRHVDFFIIDTTKPIQVSVPLEFIGEAPAEKDGLGLLNKALREIEIEVPAADLPSHIDVDVSVLTTLETAIHASDVVIPGSATLLTDPEVLIAKVSEQKEESEESGEMDLDAIASDTGNKEE
jgi:large subunit ribosomal protein L25